MSELIDMRANGQDFRWRLLTSVSALALMISVIGGQPASASDDDADRPTVWIELGGQLERMDSPQVPFAPSFYNVITNGGFNLESPFDAGRSSIYSNGAEAAVSYMPEDSDWIFSVSVRYGRSDGHRFLHEQRPEQYSHQTIEGIPITAGAHTPYEQTATNNSATHVIADFQAGKDVGLGMFGSESTSTLSAGIRFAQFSAKSNIIVNARPDNHFAPGTIFGFPINLGRWHQYFGSAQREENFKGLGPSISWNASAPFIGSPQGGEIALDWGVNAAALFGRQKAKAHFHTSVIYYYGLGVYPHYPRLPGNGTGNRSRTVFVPNIGGFAGLSYNFPNAKLSVGYRADLFFGAMDGGLTTAKRENQGFYGPFASVSVGLGG